MGARWYLKTEGGAFPGAKTDRQTQKNRGEGGLKLSKQCLAMDQPIKIGLIKPILEQRLHQNGTEYRGLGGGNGMDGLEWGR